MVELVSLERLETEDLVIRAWAVMLALLAWAWAVELDLELRVALALALVWAVELALI